MSLFMEYICNGAGYQRLSYTQPMLLTQSGLCNERISVAMVRWATWACNQYRQECGKPVISTCLRLLAALLPCASYASTF